MSLAPEHVLSSLSIFLISTFLSIYFLSFFLFSLFHYFYHYFLFRSFIVLSLSLSCALSSSRSLSHPLSISLDFCHSFLCSALPVSRNVLFYFSPNPSFCLSFFPLFCNAIYVLLFVYFKQQWSFRKQTTIQWSS